MSVNVAVLGAAGAVGSEIVSILEETNFPVKELKLFGSKRSAGEEVIFMGEKIIIDELADGSLKGIDIVLSALPEDIIGEIAPSIKNSGAVLIDNSSVFRLDKDVPLVIPEINPGDAFKHKGIIANPNCTTIIALMAVYALHRHSPIVRIIASSFQSVSGAGYGGMDELLRQISDFTAGNPLKNDVFQAEILNNLIPVIGETKENGYTSEELKFLNEGRKILNAPDMSAAVTCVRVPVLRSHSVSLAVETKDDISPEMAKELLLKAKGVALADCPMPALASGKNLVYVGRIRKNMAGRGLNLFVTGDQIRKGAALNAVQIAELLAKGQSGQVMVC